MKAGKTVMSDAENNSAGILYLVPTPIGNLKDITLRALEVLKNADIIAAEDTRQTLKLLNHYEIKKPLISYHKFNEKEKSSGIINNIKEGKKVALVTDAGTPGISDPGSILVVKCIEEGVRFEVLPGATAFTTALIYSGLDTTGFVFRGFMPRTNKAKQLFIEEIKDYSNTIILYEAPHRLVKTLQYLLESLGDRSIALCRELTKIHEEITRTTISGAIKLYDGREPKGEFVLVMEGKTRESIEEEKAQEYKGMSVEQHIIMYMNKGLSKKEAIKLVAQDRKLPKSEIYRCSLNI